MTEESQTDKIYFRLSDRILEALKLALEQKDIAISELLTRSLEMSMTRGAGGRGFIERREFSDEVEKALATFDQLKREAKGL
jgi:hypothetical protein